MKRTLFVGLVTAIAIILFGSCTAKKGVYNEGINIIPTPLSMTLLEGDGFVLGKSVEITVNAKEGLPIAYFFENKLKLSTGAKIKVEMRETPGNINLFLDENFDSKGEGYSLKVTPEGVNVTAKTPAGLFYGMQTFLQLLPAEVESVKRVSGIEWKAPSVDIKDEPRFGYRGVLLDVCRHFAPVDFIKKQLDVMALFKINRFHWHLTEDQAWRVEIKKYPLLTEIGSKRVEGEGFEHSGFYTQEEIKEIVAYAAERQITIVPELEVPGHELAAIAAYPELSCKGEPITPRIVWGVEDIVMCPGKEDMFVFLENVISELAPLFPGEYFHIGGDECPKSSWKECPLCQAKIKKEGFKSNKNHTAEEYLQSYVIRRVEAMLAKYGKKIIGWDEILEGGLAPTATVMSWRGEEGGIAAANEGHDAIMTPGSQGMYIDHYQGDSKIEPVAIGGYSTLEKVYSYDPVPQSLIESGKAHHIIGVQNNLWAEYLYTTDLVEYRLWPRAIALSEIAWSVPENKNFGDFSRRIENALVRLDNHNINYHIPLPEQPNGSCDYVAFTDKATLEFTTTRPMRIIYTLNGAIPADNSATYTEPITIDKTTTLKICTILPSGKKSPVRTITVEKQTLAPALTVEAPKSGILMKSTPGYYLNVDELNKSEREWSEESVVTDFFALRALYPSNESVRNFPHYAAIGTGFVNIPEDGVYYFSSNNDEVWIDGKLLINNKNEVKKFSRNDKSVALAAGMHEIKVVFLSHIIGGVPSVWDAADVKIRKEGNTTFEKITAEMLFHQ